MNFIEYTNTWVKQEVLQGRIMIGIGVLFFVVLITILRSNHELLRGAVIPLSLLILLLVGYGSYILNSRPAHAKESIALYKSSKEEGIANEKTKHTNDNKAGKLLLKMVYPSLMILSVLVVIFIPSVYYKGMALGFVLLFLSAYVIDYGFVSRSDAFLSFLNKYI